MSRTLWASLALTTVLLPGRMQGQAGPPEQTATPAPTPTQAPAPTPAPTPAPAAPPPWTLGPVEVSGLVDGYYSLNFEHPASRNNVVRNFDVKANQFSLNMAKLVLVHDADPVGIRVDFAFGRSMDIFHASEPKDAPQILRNLEQAFVTWKPKEAKGLQVDFGKFVTSAGAEVTETHANWNYSRSLLYALGPYYHFGLRTAMPVNKWWTAGFQVVNGWNDVEDNNTGKSFGITSAMTGGKVSWFNNYYFGPEKADTNQGWRHFYDTVVGVNPTSKLSFLGNFDYGVEKAAPGSKDQTFWGISGNARYAFNDWFAVSPRLEYYRDEDGFITGKKQSLKELTLTGEFKMKKGLLARLEYRRDMSDQPFFDRGNGPATSKTQTTLLLGIIAYFGKP